MKTPLSSAINNVIVNLLWNWWSEWRWTCLEWTYIDWSYSFITIILPFANPPKNGSEDWHIRYWRWKYSGNYFRLRNNRKKITIQFPVSFCNALHTHLLKYNTINAYLMLFLRQKNIHSFLEMYCEINFFCGIFFNNCLKHLHKISIQWEWEGRHKKICVLIDGNIFFSSHLSYFVSGI